VAMNVGVGMAAASYWRGLWYVMDDLVFPQNALHSATTSLGLGVAGVAMWSRGFVDATVGGSWQKGFTSLRRFASLYVLSGSVVMIWRGTWMLWDIAYEHAQILKAKATIDTRPPLAHSLGRFVNTALQTPQILAFASLEDARKVLESSESPLPIIKATDPGHALSSGMLSHAVGTMGLLTFGLFASVLAPPAAACILRDSAIKPILRTATTTRSRLPNMTPFAKST